MLCVYFKEQLRAYTSKFRTKELRDSKREIEPQAHGPACSITGKANGKIYEPKIVCAQGLAVIHSTLGLPLCHIYMSPPPPPKKKEKKKLKKLPVQVRKSGFAGIGWSNTPRLSNIIKDYSFVLIYFNVQRKKGDKLQRFCLWPRLPALGRQISQ